MTPIYKLKIHHKVEKQLQRIPKNQLERVVNTMRSLRDDPRPPGCLKLEEQLYRIRQGQYRIIYAVFDEEVVKNYRKIYIDVICRIYILVTSDVTIITRLHKLFLGE